MGQTEGNDLNYEIVFAKKCGSEFKKLKKKMNPNLLNEIEQSIDELKTNPELGEELSQDLAGMGSIHLNKYNFRILYDVKDNPSRQIVILKTGYRKDFYSDFSRYRDLPK